MQLFTETIINIISNHIPRETMNCYDSNPPCIDEKIKKLIFHKNRAFSAYSQERNNTERLLKGYCMTACLSF